MVVHENVKNMQVLIVTKIHIMESHKHFTIKKIENEH